MGRKMPSSLQSREMFFWKKTVEQYRAIDPALAVVCSLISGLELDQMFQRGLTKVFCPPPFGKGIALLLSFDGC